jgi:hypothetical protein
MVAQASNERAVAVAVIAERYLGIETLETRNTDSLDFHELGVASIKAALEAAYEAGRSSAAKARR